MQLKKIVQAILLTSPLLVSTLYAATPINLVKQKPRLFKSLAASSAETSIVETSRHTDVNNTLHIRFNQTYLGYPVWGADGVVHVPQGNKNLPLNALATHANSSFSGQIYQDLATDLGHLPRANVNQSAQQALETAIAHYEHKIGTKIQPENKNSNLIVYVDFNQKAHWAYKVEFYLPKFPAAMNYIIDAKTHEIYLAWDNIQTANTEQGGGYGGNPKMGKIIYDGTQGNFPALTVTRDGNTCSLVNKSIAVYDADDSQGESSGAGDHVTYKCAKPDAKHNNVYWDDTLDSVNKGYSPDNDALYNGQVIRDLYRDWYKTDILSSNKKKSKPLTFIVHGQFCNPMMGGCTKENAAWNPETKQMIFGDGEKIFYPLTSLDIAAHEVSHAFTTSHSNMFYMFWMGGMNESFSDMAAQAGEYYATGKNDWLIGGNIFKEEGKAIRYMDHPSKDCTQDKKPGTDCSIENVKDFNMGTNVHYSSGIYNRVFYLMATAKGYDVRKAFDVMVKANEDYWTQFMTFDMGACGVLSAAKDLKYNTKPILAAFDAVGVKTTFCY